MVYRKQKLKNFIKECYRPEKCLNVVALKEKSEIWNGNLLSSHRMTDINLRKDHC